LKKTPKKAKKTCISASEVALLKRPSAPEGGARCPNALQKHPGPC